MPGTSRSELYFIAAMMVLIIIVCAIAVVAFIKTYRKEMRESDRQRETKDRETDKID